MTRTVAIVQARLGSRRLPGKVLYELCGRPLLAFMIERVRRTEGVDEVLLATGDGAENNALEAVATDLGIRVFRGSEDDVLNRFAGAAAAADADILVRLTGDCPLADPTVIGAVIRARAAAEADYATNVHPPSWPDGLDISVFTRAALDRAAAEAELKSEREHVVPWMWRMSPLEGGSDLTAVNLPCPDPGMAAHRWTIDDDADYRMLRALAAAMGPQALFDADWRGIADALDAHPDIRAINAAGVRDEGLAKSRAED